MPRKRGNHEGTVYKRESDGKWVAAVTLGHTAKGSPKRQVVYGKTRAEAARKLADLMDKYHKGLLADPSTLTVAEFAKTWLNRKANNRAVGTVRNYTTELEYACARLGHMRLQAVKPIHVQRLLDHLASEGYTPKPRKAPDGSLIELPSRPYSPRSQKMVLQRLSALFKDAVHLEIVYRNPCAGIRVEADDPEPVGRTLEPDELAVLLGVCADHPMGLYFRVLLDTGLRRGEGLALTWADLDLDAKQPHLSVNKSWAYGKGGGYLTRPKSKRSYRRVPVPPELASVLRITHHETVSRYGKAAQGLYLFGNPVTNTPYEPNSPNHALSRICEASGLEHIRVHDLRHTYGSILLAHGVPVEVVSEWMGHANPSITLKVYRHLLKWERSKYVFSVSSTATPPAKKADSEHAA